MVAHQVRDRAGGHQALGAHRHPISRAGGPGGGGRGGHASPLPLPRRPSLGLAAAGVPCAGPDAFVDSGLASGARAAGAWACWARCQATRRSASRGASETVMATLARSGLRAAAWAAYLSSLTLRDSSSAGAVARSRSTPRRRAPPADTAPEIAV